jgi:hydrogenase nickel incorporation protein HypB
VSGVDSGSGASVRLIDLERKVTEKNDLLAGEIRARLRAARVFTVNLLSGPGAGKTSLLERTLEALGPAYRALVIEGDLFTQNDADRIARLGVPAVQIQTRGACHLDSRMVGAALEGVDLDRLDLLVIENVGNLVCPTGFDLGEDLKVVMAAVTDGTDKPAKYPYIFERAGVVLLNKTDLLPYVSFDLEQFARTVRGLNGTAPLFHLSCATGEGLTAWYDWLRTRIAARRAE